MAKSQRNANTRARLTTAERLNVCVAILDTIDRNRARQRDPGIGASIERQIIERELRELEYDIAVDPGVLDCHIVRVRRNKRAADSNPAGE